jgi:hypothetical protein
MQWGMIVRKRIIDPGDAALVLNSRPRADHRARVATQTYANYPF